MARQTAIITGASKGLGAEYARLLAKDGVDLVLVARSEPLLRDLAKELTAQHNIEAHVEPTDLTDPAAPERLFRGLKDRGIDVDILINNAGFGSSGDFVNSDASRELEMIQVNITALTHLTRLVLPEMVARNKGSVLNVASTAGFQSGPGMAVYYATKAYVISFSEAIAYELRDSGVTVTAHCPGATETEFGKTADNGDSRLFALGAADAASVAKDGYQAMKAGKMVAIAGPVNWIGAISTRVTPRAVLRPLVAWLNAKA